MDGDFQVGNSGDSRRLYLRRTCPKKTPPLKSESGAFAERWVQSAKDEFLSKSILFGEGPRLRTLAERALSQQRQPAFPIWRSVGTVWLGRQGRRVEPQFLQGPDRCEVLANVGWLDQISRDLFVIGPGDINIALAAANSYNRYSS